MPSITFTFSSDNAQRIIDAIISQSAVPEGKTRAEWAKECLRQEIIEKVKDWETQLAIDVARDSITVGDDVIE